MKRNPTLPPNFMLGYAMAAPNLQNYGSQGRRDLDNIFAKMVSIAHHSICQANLY
ncbi:hypothetical protein [Nostoc sp. C052]|uniref:hypothetical protein n=1 Tax=Nostoc sp. C052 TaxID=2576902 RepID=UPI0015C3F497|nr:hypothetical protein [Nostoc sp. C052]